jgi:hypothetical protein
MILLGMGYSVAAIFNISHTCLSNDFWRSKGRHYFCGQWLADNNFAEGDISMLRWMEFGVNVARRGWLEKKDLMNSRSCRDVRFKS